MFERFDSECTASTPSRAPASAVTGGVGAPEASAVNSA